MRKSLFIAIFVALGLWAVFAAILLGLYLPTWMPEAFAALERPSSLADFGQAFSAFEGIISSFALMLGLIAILIQVRQNTDANVIGAISARQQFLLAEHARLDTQIAEHVNSFGGTDRYDQKLVDNMVNKRKSRRQESAEVDEKLKKLIERM